MLRDYNLALLDSNGCAGSVEVDPTCLKSRDHGPGGLDGVRNLHYLQNIVKIRTGRPFVSVILVCA